MQTMEQIVYKFLEERKKSNFNSIWENVYSLMKEEWSMIYSHSTEKDIYENKIGELYVILTTKGDFIKVKDEWTLTKLYSYDEIKKFKLNITKLED